MQETQETWVRSLSQVDPLEEEMVTHFSILNWKIPRTEELAGCSPWGHKELDMTEQVSTSTTTILVSGSEYAAVGPNPVELGSEYNSSAAGIQLTSAQGTSASCDAGTVLMLLSSG